MIRIKRIYEEPSPEDGVRILVDRLWPRGISKEEAKLDEWLKEIGPSHELRKWFNHDPDKFESFKKKYKKELERDEQSEALKKLKDLIKGSGQTQVTLLFAAKNEEQNQAVVLKEILDE